MFDALKMSVIKSCHLFLFLKINLNTTLSEIKSSYIIIIMFVWVSRNMYGVCVCVQNCPQNVK